MRTSATDLTGKKFGRLLVLKETAERGKYGHIKWVCKCDCGKVKTIFGYSLTQNNAKSCGCLNKEIITKHGRWRTREYMSWQNAKARCNYSNSINYHNYGGRGIKMCKEWENSFDKFFKDMGECPKGKQLDRINNYGNYEPSNCRWATRSEQNFNRRTKQQILQERIKNNEN